MPLSLLYHRKVKLCVVESRLQGNEWRKDEVRIVFVCEQPDEQPRGSPLIIDMENYTTRTTAVAVAIAIAIAIETSTIAQATR